MKRKIRGVMLLDLVIGSGISLMVMAALMALMSVTYNTLNLVQGMGQTDNQGREAIDTIADNLRNAQSSSEDEDGENVQAVFKAASQSSVTCFTDDDGDETATYWLDTTASPPSLKLTKEDDETTIVVNDITSLTFTYYVSGGNYTAGSGSWVTTADPHNPTNAELANIGAVKIQLTASVNGYSRTLTTTVRLNNSPHITQAPLPD